MQVSSAEVCESPDHPGFVTLRLVTPEGIRAYLVQPVKSLEMAVQIQAVAGEILDRQGAMPSDEERTHFVS